MDIWDNGNFDNDAAGIVLDALVVQIAHKIKIPRKFDDIDRVMALVGSIQLLVRHANVTVPNRPLLARVFTKVLKVFDNNIDDYDPEPSYKHGRRQVIEQTFTSLLRGPAKRKRW